MEHRSEKNVTLNFKTKISIKPPKSITKKSKAWSLCLFSLHSLSVKAFQYIP